MSSADGWTQVTRIVVTTTLAAALIMGSMAGPALASDISIDQSGGRFVFHFQAAPGETNDVTIVAYDPSSTPGVGLQTGTLSITDHFNLMTAHGDNCHTTRFEPGDVNWQNGDPSYSADCFYEPSQGGPRLARSGEVEADLGDGNDKISFGGSLLGAFAANGDAGNDVLDASKSYRAALDGGDGKDTLTGVGAKDDLGGGAGADTIYAGGTCTPGAVDGGSGFDTLSSATCRGASVNLGRRIHRVESYVGSPYADHITGSKGADTIDGAGGNDVVAAGDGKDVVDGGSGDDVLHGGPGSDAISGGTGFGDKIFGDKGGDTLYDVDGGVASGGPGNDHLTGGQDSAVKGPLKLTGGPGKDTLRASSGSANTLDGGSGNDTLRGSGPSTLVDGSGNDRVIGGLLADVVIAGDGKDTYIGGKTACPASCSPYQPYDRDTITYRTAKHPVKVSQDGKANDGAAHEKDDVSGFEIVVGSKFADTLTGGGSAQELRGLGGNDALTGGDGMDVLAGGPGDDRMEGRAGDDVLDGGLGADALSGGSGHDRVCYGCLAEERKGPVFVSLDGKANDGNAADNVGQASVAQVATEVAPEAPPSVSAVRDNVADDVEVIEGTAFADRLFGGPHDDELIGGAGSKLFGNAGSDTLSLSTFSNPDGPPATLNGGDGNDKLSASEDFAKDLLIGGPGDDKLMGGLGDDRLFGNDGNDTLDGRSGADNMTGGAGVDSFACDVPADHVSDRAAGETATGCR
ncbi:MAG: hypothetical protein QOJ37_678 [Pseudonocardiales bacterium]|nr:hypothetical protein [Pseudonocardiales bacterium]